MLLVMYAVITMKELSMRVLLVQECVLVMSYIILVLSMLLVILVVLQVLSTMKVLAMAMLPQLDMNIQVQVLVLLVQQGVFDQAYVIYHILVIITRGVVAMQYITILQLGVLDLFFLYFKF